MQMRPEYADEEIAIHHFANDHDLIDERWFTRMQDLPSATARFRRKFHAMLRETDAEGNLLFDENWRKPELESLATHIFQDYYHAFTYKVSMGEVWSERHPGTDIEENSGYQAGATYVDLVTHDAMARLSHHPMYDVTAENSYGEAGDKNAMKALGKIITATLHTVRSLEPLEANVREVDPLKQKILIADPRPRLLSIEERGRIGEIIDHGPRTSAEKWRGKALGDARKLSAELDAEKTPRGWSK